MQDHFAPNYSDLTGARTTIGQGDSGGNKRIKEKSKQQDKLDKLRLQLEKRKEKDPKKIKELYLKIKNLEKEINSASLDTNFRRLALWQSRMQFGIEKQKDLNMQNIRNIFINSKSNFCTRFPRFSNFYNIKVFSFFISIKYCC